MSGWNWTKDRQLQMMRDRGVDRIADQAAPYVPSGKPPRPRKSKAEQRAEAEAALIDWQRRKGRAK